MEARIDCHEERRILTEKTLDSTQGGENRPLERALSNRRIQLMVIGGAMGELLLSNLKYENFGDFAVDLLGPWRHS